MTKQSGDLRADKRRNIDQPSSWSQVEIIITVHRLCVRVLDYYLSHQDFSNLHGQTLKDFNPSLYDSFTCPFLPPNSNNRSPIFHQLIKQLKWGASVPASLEIKCGNSNHAALETLWALGRVSCPAAVPAFNVNTPQTSSWGEGFTTQGCTGITKRQYNATVCDF